MAQFGEAVHLGEDTWHRPVCQAYFSGRRGGGEFPERWRLVLSGEGIGSRKQKRLCIFLFEEIRSKMFLATFTVVWMNIAPQQGLNITPWNLSPLGWAHETTDCSSQEDPRAPEEA